MSFVVYEKAGCTRLHLPHLRVPGLGCFTSHVSHRHPITDIDTENSVNSRYLSDPELPIIVSEQAHIRGIATECWEV